MVDLAALSMVRDIVTILGVIGGFTYYVMNVRATQRNLKQQLETRQAQLLVQLYDRFSDTDFITNTNMARENARNSKSIKEYDELYRANPEQHAMFVSISRFFHGVGLLLRKGLIDINLVGELMPVTVLSTWDDIKMIIKDGQTRIPYIWEHYEYLVEEIQKYRNDKT